MSGVCATQEIRSVTQAYPVNEKQEGHGPDGRTKKLGSLHSAANALALGLLCCVCAHLRVRGGSFGRAPSHPGADRWGLSPLCLGAACPECPVTIW